MVIIRNLPNLKYTNQTALANARAVNKSAAATEGVSDKVVPVLGNLMQPKNDSLPALSILRGSGGGGHASSGGHSSEGGSVSSSSGSSRGASSIIWGTTYSAANAIQVPLGQQVAISLAIGLWLVKGRI